VDDQQWLAECFERHRTRLRSIAYRMLGSLSEADDAVQEAWLRLSRSDAGEIGNLGAWLTTVVSRVSLDMLRSRRSRREESLSIRLPDPIVDHAESVNPEHQALLADSLGTALLVVLETLNPAERLAFVLHDMFDLPFDDIASIVERSPEATRQLASRARRRVRATDRTPEVNPAEHREVVDAFLAASRQGDLPGLIAVLDPDVVLRADRGPAHPGGVQETRGVQLISRQAVSFMQLGLVVHPVLVNGLPGAISTRDGQPFSLMSFTVSGGSIIALEIYADPAFLAQVDPAIFMP
jgi:RNA polymerase sigma factor (sigma-70 family)